MNRLTKEELRAKLTPQNAFELLQQGNQRFVSNLKVNRNLLQQASETSNGQHPFAAILSCIDSRTSAELIFDQGLGDVFSIRIAGSIINDDIIGSLEFSCKIAGAKIIVVLGHTRCGAIQGAVDRVILGKLTALLAKIGPAIEAEQTITENRTSTNKVFLEKVTEFNVKHTVQAILEKSPTLKEMLTTGAIGIVGGNHDIATGTVTFYPDTLLLNSDAVNKFGFFKTKTVRETQSGLSHEPSIKMKSKL